MDILFFLKQIIGVIIGIVIGLSGLKGMVAIILYGVSASGLAYLYTFRFLGVD
jgi:hypothetical protein